MTQSIFIAALLAILFMSQPSEPIVYAQPQETVVATTTNPEPEKPKLRDALVPICACESVGKKDGVPQQFNADGSVVHGRIDPDDRGLCQINRRYWGKKSEELGYNIETEDGNISMANWIYDHEGVEPWRWSKPCWK